MSGHRVKVLACVPAYNEEKTIASILVRASRHVDELIVIDDGSEDDTGLIAERLGMPVIRHRQNQGKGIALRDCFEWSKNKDFDVLVTIDADGQHDPDEIPSLINPIQAGKADIVIGCRSVRPPEMKKMRRFAQRILDGLVGVRENGILVDSQSGFRAYSKAAFSNLRVTEWSLGAESEILLQAKKLDMRISQVPVHMRYHRTETRKRNPFVHFTDITFTLVKSSFVRRPLRVFGIPGSLMLLVGLYGWLEVLATYNTARGFALGHALVYTTILLGGIVVTTMAILLFVLKIMLQEAY